MEGTRARYQHGSIRRENRKNGPAVWTLRWREYKPDSSFSRPKKIIGTVEQFPKKAEAWKACEHLRSTINREARTPTTVAELVTHYTEKELRKLGPYTAEVYLGYISKWLLPTWGALSLADVKTVEFESWLETLKLKDGSRAKVRNIMSAIYSHGMRWEFTDRKPHFSCAAISETAKSAVCIKRGGAPRITGGTHGNVLRDGVCGSNNRAANFGTAGVTLAGL
jgi:hypothetical protein